MSARVKKRERYIERESCLSRTRGFSLLLLVFTKKKKKKKNEE